MIWELFLPLISFLGLVAGIILAKVSPEEMKPGRNYFIVFRLAILILLIIFLVYYSRNSVVFLLIGFVVGYFLRYTYLYLGIAAAASFFGSKTHIFVISSLIFLYGLPYGTLLESHRKIPLKKLMLLLGMFIIPFILLFFESYINAHWLFAFSGGLLVGSLKKEF